MAAKYCGVFHPYAEVYQSLRPTTLDVGWGTDLKTVRKNFPTTPLVLELQAIALVGKTEAEIDALVGRMLEEAEPVELISTIWVAEAGQEIPDSTVRRLVTAPARLLQNPSGEQCYAFPKT